MEKKPVYEVKYYRVRVSEGRYVRRQLTAEERKALNEKK